MTIPPRWDAALATLDQYRSALLGHVADQLTFTVPLLAVPPTAADPAGHHQRQMYASVARLHDSLQAARLHEQLLVHELAWAGQVLPRWGVSVEHLMLLIDTYVSSAQALGTWGPEEREVLEEIRGYLHQLALTAFRAPSRTP